MAKYNYVVFCPYFGKLPNNINLWLKSCSYNNNIKFIVLTDDNKNLDLPANVEVILITFDKLKKMIQSKFDCKISLESPYKLCDYKTAYGYIFENYLNGCKYWGACDMDLVFGDIIKFLPTEDFDKISNRGHFMLLKNTKNLREAFMLNNTSKIDYKNILSNEMHFASDEIGDYGINNILLKNDYKIYPFEKTMADISTRRVNMRISPIKSDKKYGKRVFCFDNGKIFCYELKNNIISKKEYSYIHFQKRKMKMNITNNNLNKFIITYCSFEDYEEITKDYIIKHQPKYSYNFNNIKLKYNSLKKKIKRAYIINKIKKNGDSL